MKEERAQEAGGKAQRKRPRLKICYKCAEYVPDDAEKCPKCGATGGGFNPAWLYRIVLGFILGFMLWLIFWV